MAYFVTQIVKEDGVTLLQMHVPASVPDGQLPTTGRC